MKKFLHFCTPLSLFSVSKQIFNNDNELVTIILLSASLNLTHTLKGKQIIILLLLLYDL